MPVQIDQGAALAAASAATRCAARFQPRRVAAARGCARYRASTERAAFLRRQVSAIGGVRRLEARAEPKCVCAWTVCRKLLEARKTRSGLASTVRDRMVTGSARMPTMAFGALGPGLRPYGQARGGHRHRGERDPVRARDRAESCAPGRLLDEGATFAELRDEVRLALAEEFLTGPRLSIEQIADRLGYAETTRKALPWKVSRPSSFG